MASACVAYTLVGFAAELDWRPLHFLKPIPRLRICNTCGLVRKRTVLSPCGHVLCEACYDQCAQEGERVCPLDGLLCTEEDIEWREWPAEEVLKRQVKCWNEESGCTAVVAASAIFRHFQRDCGHHSAPCPKCSASVLCSDVCAHLRSDCENLRTTPAADCRAQTMRSEEPLGFTISKLMLEKQAGEMKALLQRLLSDFNSLGDRLNEISHGQNAFTETIGQQMFQATQIIASHEETKQSAINTLSSRIGALQETLKGEIVNAREQNGDEISRLAAAVESMKAEAKESYEKTLGSINAIGSHYKLQVKRCEFFVKGVTSLLAEAEKQGCSRYISLPVYLRGYCMAPGILIKTSNGSVTLHFCVQLHKGDIDDVVLWPCEHQMKLTFIHPQSDKERQIVYKPCRSNDCLKRPSIISTQPVIYNTPSSLNFCDLWLHGYVYADQLRVRFELLP